MIHQHVVKKQLQWLSIFGRRMHENLKHPHSFQLFQLGATSLIKTAL